MIERNDPTWYRDAIIYQVHVKSFQDSNGDGIGDFEGLTSRLDYIRELGATAIWVMPFYPSPLRDDGYDIADYRTINPHYGAMRDFRRFVREAHARDLRVITELVINHTSDEHPWFQRARAARPGSAARDFYVWSDKADRFKDARIIFVDSEASNWTWDHVAGAYFWHRFYHHQPDLNFDNPRVLEAVLDVMRFWLDMGVDGLRLDAIPYLVERDGTNCENLPETHAVIKKIRAAVDARYPDRMLLAEANQWPEDAATYFGDGDECHMSFHFPLMPRIFISLATEDRHPITDIMRQTPEIPEGAQWAIFLRNHDELTLEMVTGNERDYLWSFYAAEKRARINLGIRRRLAPLLENDRRKIELLNFLLLSMPGTPVLYYGDEIGMGDNIYLGDRDGVRTPMQWSPDRNGGFSKANPARLFLPAIQDSMFGFTSVNVEAQAANPSSMLNWMRGMIAVRRRHRAFGRGSFRFLYPENRKVLAYLREDEGEALLCVANVSSAPQAVELDLSQFKGYAPQELGAGSIFPAIGGLPYLLTLPAYGYFWFLLDKVSAAKERFGPTPMEVFTLVLTGRPERLLTGREASAFEETIAPRFLQSRRWFAGKDGGIARVRIAQSIALPAPSTRKTMMLVSLDVEDARGGRECYFTPLVIDEDERDEGVQAYIVAKVRRGARIGVLVDAEVDANFAEAMLTAFTARKTLPLDDGGALVFSSLAALPDDLAIAPGAIRRLGAEQSNSSILFGDAVVMKLYRKLQEGVNPEVELTRHLAQHAGFANVAPIYGALDLVRADGEATCLAILQQYVRNQGDAWRFVLEELRRSLSQLTMPDVESQDEPDDERDAETFLPQVIGRRTAELHKALARASEDPAFAPEKMTHAVMAAERAAALETARRAFDALERLRKNHDAPPAVAALVRRRAECLQALAHLTRDGAGLPRTRIHGDFHLGQVLLTERDVVFVDFEGEPGRSLAERRAKACPLQDVAGMLRSFSYAGEIAARDVIERLALDPAKVRKTSAAWVRRAARKFLQSYRANAAGLYAASASAWNDHLRFQSLRKALYEIEYEAANRPEWVDIPIAGVFAMLGSRGDVA